LKPGSLTIATIGEGTSTNLAALMLEKKTNIKFTYIPYKGSATAITDVMSGTVDLMFEGGASSLPFVKQGKLKALAVTSEKRNEIAAAGIPTASETIPGYSIETWFGIVGPAGIPYSTVEKINKQIKVVQQSSKVKELATIYGANIVHSTPEQFARRIAGDLRDYASIMKEAGIKPQ
jgi:tripartite-type tricarboxylate transporter receptor subunit TctC